MLYLVLNIALKKAVVMTSEDRTGERNASSTVLATLGVDGPMSRADLARRLSLSPATVTQATKQLLAGGLLRELNLVPSSGGRPATLLGLAFGGASALGAKVSAERVTTVRVALDGTAQTVAEHPFDAAHPEALDRLVVLLRDELEQIPGTVLGIGIGLPGSVADQAIGTVDSTTLGWRETHVGAHLRGQLGVPVLVDNDVNTLAVAERLQGVAREYDSPLIVTIGLGIGSALIAEGQLYRGSRGGAGEVGHIPVADGPACPCGGTGCLEAVIGEHALLESARSRGVVADGAVAADLHQAAIDGDETAREIYAEAGALLGRTLAGVVHLAAPDALIVLGEGTVAWSFWESRFTESLRRHLMPSRRGLPVRVEQWTDEKWAVGAASLVLFSPFDQASGEQGLEVNARLHDSLSRQAAG